MITPISSIKKKNRNLTPRLPLGYIVSYLKYSLRNHRYSDMAHSKGQSFRSFSYEEELQRAKGLKEDLDKGGWRQVHMSPGACYWMKTFYNDEVPIKSLFTFDMPMPAEKFVEMLNPSNQEIRKKWDEVFKDHVILEAYPDNGGYLTSSRIKTTWPLADREFLLFIPPVIQVDWYGKESWFIIQKNAWHLSKPESENGLVRAINGGNFYIVTPDDERPEAARKVFSLTNNNYNGRLPKTRMEWMLSRAVPRGFNGLRASMINGYKKYFQNAQE